jgi:hypothetical protein
MKKGETLSHMKMTFSALALIAGLGLAGSGFAQDAATGGPTAKGNAPVKSVHTVNDGAAKPGANSFTQDEARQHILNSGYTDVSGLTKGEDGVWRGMATKGGAARSVGLDFKGNVSEAAPMSPSAAPVAPAPAPAPAPAAETTPAPPAAAATAEPATEASSADRSGDRRMMSHSVSHRHRHHRRGRHGAARCVQPGPNGVACSGVDRNRNGVSDKEDHAMKAGAKP